MLKFWAKDLRQPLQDKFKFHLVIFILKMPFYAVAVGKTPGVYTSWSECESQTKGYPQAKYRKFDTQAEAFNFIKTMGSESSTSGLNRPNMVENLKPAKMNLLGKYGSQTLLKQDKLGLIAEKLDKFIDETNKRLVEFSDRLESLERLFHSENTTKGKRKKDDDVESTEKTTIKRKKKANKSIGVTIELSEDEDNTSASIALTSSSTYTNGTAEDVDGNWNRNVSSDGFILGADGFVIVYTDGACSNNGRNNAKAGLGVWFNHNNPFNVAAPVEGTATNNNAEIQAATRAIEQARLAGIKRLNIHTDSQFMINCITSWMKKWKKNNWVTTNGGPVKNKVQLEILDSAIQRMEAVRWTHVRGHVGMEGNECADSLARAGATMS